MKRFFPFACALCLSLLSLACAHDLLGPDTAARVTTPQKALSLSRSSVIYPLRIDFSQRFLVDQTGTPVYVSGDAAWSLIAQLGAADANTYLQNRSQMGFNVVLVNLIEHLFSRNAPANIYNVAPFTGRPFATPNPAYFQYADSVISMASSYGITVLLDPLYLGYACSNQGWCAEVEAATTAELGAWGSYLGKHYGNFPNIIWCIGGDMDPTPIKSKVQTVIDSMRAYDRTHLFTAHNNAEQFAVTPWAGATGLNLNDIYTYSTTLYTLGQSAYQYTPTMPFFLIESAYENEHSSTPASLRAQAYWTVLSGGFGEIFGNNPIWLFGSGWQTALGSAGSVSMKNLALLFNSRYWYKLVPDFGNTIITSGRGSSTSYATACWTTDSSSILAYLPTSRKISVSTSRISGSSATCYWYNPSNGAVTSLGTFSKGTLSFTPPASGDWIFVADASTIAFPLPGGGPAVPAPTGTFTATPDTLPVGGGQTTLAWSSQNDTTASIDQGIGPVGLTGSTVATLTQTTTFTLTISGIGGTKQYPLTVFVATPLKPTGTLSVSPSSLPYGGGQAVLKWTSQNATADTLNQGIGAVAPSDSLIVHDTVTTTYTLSLTGAGGTQSYSATVTVAPPPKPTGTFSANPSALPIGGGQTKLVWTSLNATSASISPNVGAVGLNDSTVLTLGTSTTYTLTLNGPGGTQQYTTTVTVAVPPPPTATFTATPSSLGVGGGQVTLRWASQNATSASINQGIGAVALSDSLVVTDTVTTSYTLTVSSPQGTASYTATVTVAPRVPPFEAIFDDAYENSWNTIRSWTTTLTPTNTSPVKDGKYSLKVVEGAWASLQFSKGTWGAFQSFSPSSYSSLSFWITGGATAVSGLVVSCINSSNSNIKTVTLSTIPANTWVQETIPIASLAGTSSFVAIGVTDGGGSVTFYLDDVQLNK
ncbi:MAG TPA: glycoside hydrolase family 140 protein [Bacteroidota bacterium]|nr:glycoside hydrolase family 140 protein [Bacteroidota bacterium]